MPEDGIDASTSSDRGPGHGATTPPAWRVAALAILGGGFAIGAAAAGGGGAGWLVGGSLAVVIVALVPIIRGSRRPPIGPNPTAPATPDPLPSITVLVAGRDEAAVLPRLIEDLAVQDRRPGGRELRFEVIVVDDRSTDGSGPAVVAAARRTGLGDAVRVIRREGEGLPDGKAAALTAAQPEVCRGDVVVVLDADARVGPTYLGRIATYAACGVPALTSRRRILGAETSNLAGAQADEQTQDGELQRGRWATGGCSEFRGNGFAVSRALLAEVGGWRANALTEDIDLSSRLAAATGVTVAWALDVEVWEEPVRTWAGLWHQRLRWSEGAVRRLLEHGPAVLRSRRLPFVARLDFAAYGVQLVAPTLVLGATAGAVLTGSPAMAAALVATYLGAGGVLAFDALRWEREPGGARMGLGARVFRSIRAALFSAIWLGAVPGALWRLAARRGDVRYVKMVHLGHDVDGRPVDRPPGATPASPGGRVGEP
jgi:hypothetical protein